MALTDGGNGMYMPVAPANGNGFGGCDGWWIILFLFALMGNGFGGFGGAGGYDFPWLLKGQGDIKDNANAGFQNAVLNDGITAIRTGIGDISTQLCGGFAGVNAAIVGAQNALAQQANANQLADLERSFDSQTALTQGLNGIQGQLAQFAADLKYTVASEACNTRQANAANTQAVLDKLCQLELDGYKRENDNLRSQLSAAAVANSANAAVDSLYNRLNNCPVPSTPVYGKTPIFTCQQNSGCGCGGSF